MSRGQKVGRPHVVLDIWVGIARRSQYASVTELASTLSWHAVSINKNTCDVIRQSHVVALTNVVLEGSGSMYQSLSLVPAPLLVVCGPRMI